MRLFVITLLFLQIVSIYQLLLRSYNRIQWLFSPALRLSQEQLLVYFPLNLCRMVINDASIGIGRQVAISFAAEGCLRIAICDKNEHGLEETRSLIQDSHSHVQVEVFTLDVSNEKSVVTMTTSVVEKLGRIDYAVNSAGSFCERSYFWLSLTLLGLPSHNSRSTETSTETYDRVTSVNARGLWLCSRSQLSQMLKQDPLPTHDGRPGNRGSICNIGSQLGVVSRPAARELLF